jgi:hypothetical protein
MATGQRCTVDMWRTRCAECERYFQTTAFHGHDPKLAPTLCRRCAFNKREQALTIAERTKPATRTAVAKLAAAEQRLAVARLAEQDIAKREVAIAERKRAATIADLDRRRVEAKVSAEREREAKRTADAGREAKRAAHVAGVFEHLAHAIEAASGGGPFKGAVRAVYTAWLAYKHDGAIWARANFLNYLSD